MKAETQKLTKAMPEVCLDGLRRKPRHKWFAHCEPTAENGWSGPHDHIEDAARAALLAWQSESDTRWPGSLQPVVRASGQWFTKNRKKE